ncbi:sensor histidine kinase [Microtetraspora niveoalba]|uniref:sensor histidine kinase n=1 Tax=Microtetraspora niveoalba TaxID=46175 RepID=UPI0008321E5E|nr:histidine kinase [Microtetraspora niveoalba]
MRRAAWPVCAVTLLLVTAALVLGVHNGMGPLSQSHLLFVAAYGVVGGLIGARRPGNTIGLVMAAGGLCFALLDAFGQYAIYARGAGAPLARAAAWPQTWLWVPANLTIAAIPLFFPAGRLPSPRWRPPLRALVVVALASMALSAVRPGPNDQAGLGTAVVNPLGVPALADLSRAVDPFMTVLCGVLFVAGAIDLLRRTRRAGRRERDQLKWLVYAAGLAGLIVVARLIAGLTDDVPGLVWPASSTIWELVGTLGAVLVPVSVGVAVLQHRLLDIDLVINRTFVYLLLSGCVVGGYVLTVAYLGAIFRSEGALPVSIVAAGVVALVFAPLRDRVQRSINLVMYGRRDDPYAALALLGRRLEETAEPSAVLAAVARSVAEALRLPHVAVEVAGGPSHAHGAPAPDPVRLPLVYHNEPVGELVLSPRPGESGFGARDRRVLADLARQTGVAVHSVRLSADLRRSRERLVIAREEERRRLRRDLHDGLGPTLAALTMRAEAVQDLVSDAAAKAMLEEIMGDAQAAMADVRTLVDGLRPPALDTLGLLGAIRSHVAGVPGSVGARLDVRVESAGELPALPAAVEVAAFRIAVEALANVRGHSGAAHARVRLSVAGGSLVLEVTDDGRAASAPEAGAPAGAGVGVGAGVGTASMRERAAELGGSCVIEPRAEGGTRVRAELPLGAGGAGPGHREATEGESESDEADPRAAR